MPGTWGWQQPVSFWLRADEPATNTVGKVLHHLADAAELAELAKVGAGAAAASDDVLDAAAGVDLHCAEIVEAVNQASVLAELLIEGVAEVVGGIGGDEEDGLAVLGHLDGKGARRCSLADASFAANKDPPQRLLVQNVLESRLHGLEPVGHDCGWLGARISRVTEKQHLEGTMRQTLEVLLDISRGVEERVAELDVIKILKQTWSSRGSGSRRGSCAARPVTQAPRNRARSRPLRTEVASGRQPEKWSARQWPEEEFDTLTLPKFCSLRQVNSRKRNTKY
jgi:hypothetical protein